MPPTESVSSNGRLQLARVAASHLSSEQCTKQVSAQHVADDPAGAEMLARPGWRGWRSLARLAKSGEASEASEAGEAGEASEAGERIFLDPSCRGPVVVGWWGASIIPQ